jgi:hypothetical protein
MTSPATIFTSTSVTEFELRVLQELRALMKNGEGRLELIISGGKCTSLRPTPFILDNELRELQGV